MIINKLTANLNVLSGLGLHKTTYLHLVCERAILLKNIMRFGYSLNFFFGD